MKIRSLVMAVALVAAGCSQAPSTTTEPAAANDRPLRNLVDTDVATTNPDRDLMRLKGTRIPTPSDTRTAYFLLRERTGLTGTTVAIIREERDDRVAYARTEIDCAARQFRIAGVAPSRVDAELAEAQAGQMRAMTGLPLRIEIADYICRQAGTPLAPVS